MQTCNNQRSGVGNEGNMLLFSFLYVAHFYQIMTAWITSNLILQGNMGRIGCPRCLLVWPMPGEKQKHAQSWCLDEAKEQGQGCIDPVLCFIDPHLWLVASLFSPSLPSPTFLQNFMLTACVSLSVLLSPQHLSKWCWSPWVVCIAVGQQTSEVFS